MIRLQHDKQDKKTQA